MKTQAELDADVIAAADKFMEDHLPPPVGNGPWVDYRKFMPVVDAVRARREAMRAHKAAVLSWEFSHNRVLGSGEAMMQEWNGACDGYRADIRERLAAVLAAPDEPTEGR